MTIPRTLTAEQYRALAKKPHKYGAKRTEYNGAIYDSKAEAEFAASLDLQKRIGLLRDWIRQPVFVLHANEIAIGNYVADFLVTELTGEQTVFDVKGVETELFKWKRKHFRAEYGREITVVKKR